MAQEKIIIKFEPKGHPKLIQAINRLDDATKKLQGKMRDVDKTTEKTNKTFTLFGTNTNRNAKSMGKFGNTLSVIRSKMLLFNFAMAMGGRQLIAFAQEAAKVESMERAFGTLSGGSLNASLSMEKLEEATDSTMSKFDLFQQANNAMILGVSKNSDEMAEMFDIAQRLGRALGRDTRSSVESLITGIGRQSRLMLDNIGIIVKADEAYEQYATKLGTTADKLTDAEKKQAFLAATMESARAKVKSLGEEVTSTQDSYDKLSSTLVNLRAFIGDKLNPTLAIISDHWTGVINDTILAEETSLAFTDALIKEGVMLKGHVGDYERLARKIEAYNKILNKSEESVNRINLMAQKQGVAYDDMEDKLIKSSNALVEQESIFLDNAEALALNIEQVKNTDIAWTSLEDGIRRTNTELDITPVKVQKVVEVQKTLIQTLSDHSKEAQMAARASGQIGDAITQLAGKNKDVAIFGMRLSAAAAIADSIAGAAKMFGKGGAAGYLGGVALLAQMMVRVNTINSQIRTLQAEKFEQGGLIGGNRHSQGGTIIEAERGEFVMNRKAVDSIGVDNLNAMNQGGGGAVTVNINGGMVDQNFVENELAEAIKTAIRRGSDFGVA